jgi:uncharacterized membrane protein
MTAESSKTLAGIGSILLIVPFVSIVGIILVLMGMKDLSEHYRDSRIFDGLVTGGIFLVIGLILSVFGTVFCLTLIGALIGIPLIIIAFIFELLAARAFKKAFYALSERSGEHLFHTAGTLVWIGAILSIIFVGAILIFIAYIIAAVGFFTLKITPIGTTAGTGNSSSTPYGYTPPPPTYGHTPPSPPTQQPSSTSTENPKANFCPNCGAPITPEATFCSNCGNQI